MMPDRSGGPVMWSITTQHHHHLFFLSSSALPLLLPSYRSQGFTGLLLDLNSFSRLHLQTNNHTSTASRRACYISHLVGKRIDQQENPVPTGSTLTTGLILAQHLPRCSIGYPSLQDTKETKSIKKKKKKKKTSAS